MNKKSYETKRTYVDLCEKTNKHPSENQSIEIELIQNKQPMNGKYQ